MPTPVNAQLWAERTPGGFVMNVKAFRLFTGHQTSPTVLHRDIQASLGPVRKPNLYYRDLPAELVDELWRRFHEALAPLRAAGRLGLVHFQFPPWLVCNAAGEAHLRLCVERMAGHVLSVEFRHRSWFDGPNLERTLALQRDLGLVHTVVDGPQGFANSVPAIWEATTASHALLRLHGRNSATWNVKGATAASDRFNYDYGAAEIGSLAGQIHPLAAQVGQMHVIFNNNMEDQGQRNAKSMIEALAGWGLGPDGRPAAA